jgi:hypothetical protein
MIPADSDAVGRRRIIGPGLSRPRAPIPGHVELKVRIMIPGRARSRVTESRLCSPLTYMFQPALPAGQPLSRPTSSPAAAGPGNLYVITDPGKLPGTSCQPQFPGRRRPRPQGPARAAFNDSESSLLRPGGPGMSRSVAAFEPLQVELH